MGLKSYIEPRAGATFQDSSEKDNIVITYPTQNLTVVDTLNVQEVTQSNRLERIVFGIAGQSECSLIIDELKTITKHVQADTFNAQTLVFGQTGFRLAVNSNGELEFGDAFMTLSSTELYVPVPAQFTQNVSVDKTLTVHDDIEVDGSATCMSMTIEYDANVIGNMAVYGNTDIGGNVGVNNSLIIGGDMKVANTMRSNSLSATGEVTASGEVTIGGLCHILGNVIVDGNAVFNDTVDFRGGVVVSSASTIDNDFNVNGSLTVNVDTHVGGNCYIGGDTFVVGAFDVSGTSRMNGDVTIGGVLRASNVAELNCDLTTTQDMYVGGTLTVSDVNSSGLFTCTDKLVCTQDTTIGGSLTVTGLSTFSGDATIYGQVACFDLQTENMTCNGPVTFADTVTFQGQVQVFDLDVSNLIVVEGTMNVTGDIQIDGHAHVTNSATLMGNATIVGNAEVSGLLNVSGTLVLLSLGVYGDLSVASLTTQMITVDDLVCAHGSFGSSSFAGDLTIGGTTYVDGLLVVNGDTTVTGNHVVKNLVCENVSAKSNVHFGQFQSENLVCIGLSTLDGLTTTRNMLCQGQLTVTEGIVAQGQSTLSNVDVSGLLVANVVSGNITCSSVQGGTVNVDSILSCKSLVIRDVLVVKDCIPVNLYCTNVEVTNTLNVTGKSTFDALCTVGELTVTSLDATNVNCVASSVTTLKADTVSVAKLLCTGDLTCTGITTLSDVIVEGGLSVTNFKGVNANFTGSIDILGVVGVGNFGGACTAGVVTVGTDTDTLEGNVVMTVHGDTIVSGDCACSNVRATSTIEVGGAMSVGTMNVTTANVHTLNVTGVCSFDTLELESDIHAQTITVTGTTDIVGAATIGGNTTIGGQLLCNSLTTQSISTSGNASVSGHASVGGTLTAKSISAAETTITGTAVVTGKTTVQGTIESNDIVVSGSMNAQNVQVSGTTTMHGLATMIGDCGINGNVDVGGIANFNGGLQVSSLQVHGLTITGTCTSDAITTNTLTVLQSATIGSIESNGPIQLVCNGTLVATLTQTGLTMAPGKGIFVSQGDTQYDLLESIQGNVLHVLPQ